MFKNELLENPNITGVAVKSAGELGTGTKNLASATVYFTNEVVDENYLPLLKIPFAAGRNFSSAFPADSVQSIIVNESFVKVANWKEPVGETIEMLGSSNQTFRVIGVIKRLSFWLVNQKK